MDYNKEVEKLDQVGNVWKPEVGVHELVILDEPEETQYKADNGEITPQIKLLVSIKGEQKEWFVGQGKTSVSAYGQLMIIGRSYGKLAGQKIELVVSESTGKDGGKKKTYTFPEAARIKQAETESQKGTISKPTSDAEHISGGVKEVGQ